jgi:uncharacterized membrane protein
MNISDSTPYRITFAQFSAAFIPFAILLAAALAAGESSPDPGFARTVYTIWVAAVLVTPALCAFALPGQSGRQRNVWLLFCSFSFAAYLVHMGYAVLAAYHGSFQELIDGQGVFPAIINVVFTLLWGLDVGLAWFHHRDTRWLRIERVVSHVVVGLTFFASTVVLKHGFVNVIGIGMTVAILLCLAVRYDAWRATRSQPHRGRVAPPVEGGRLGSFIERRPSRR